MCELIVAILGVTTNPNTNSSAGGDLVAFVCLFIAGFASTWGPAAWVVCAETFPLAIRAKALSLCTASNWLWNFGIGYATPYLVDESTPVTKTAALGTKVFFIWTATCACCAIFAWLFIFETSQLSLEEVDEMVTQTTPFRSAAANKAMRARRTNLDGHQARPLDDEQADHAEKKDETVFQTA